MCLAHLNEDILTNYLLLECSYVTAVCQEWLCFCFLLFPIKEDPGCSTGVLAAGLERVPSDG